LPDPEWPGIGHKPSSVDDDNDRTYGQAWLGTDWEYDR